MVRWLPSQFTLHNTDCLKTPFSGKLAVSTKGKEPESVTSASTSQTSSIHNTTNKSPTITPTDPYLDDVINRLQNSPFYLANPSLFDHVRWIDSARRRVLVENTEDDAGMYQAAALELIGIISPQNFWLYPCGGWNGGKPPKSDWQNPIPFHKVKARALVHRHHHQSLMTDWRTSLNNLDKLVQTAVTDTASQIQLDKDTLLHDDQLCIHHALFQVCMSKNNLYNIINRRFVQPKTEDTSNDQSSDHTSIPHSGMCDTLY